LPRDRCSSKTIHSLVVIVEADRAAALAAAKLEALVAARWGPAERERVTFGAGAAVVAPSRHEAWVWIERPAGTGLGMAMVWADRSQTPRLHVVVEEGAGVLARQAQLFADPVPDVWRVRGTSLVPAVASPPPVPESPVAAPELVDLLIDADLEIVVEGGVVRGEVNGLEVARIVHGATSTGIPLTEPLLEVGVGGADRELTSMLHGDLSPVDQLARAVDVVRRHRHPDASPHPLNQLVPERWLREALGRSPEAIGLRNLRPVEATIPRSNLRDRGIAVGLGQTLEGRAVVVACSVGVHLDLVPAAADARNAHDPDAELWLAIPERDVHPSTRWLAGRLRWPARLVPVPDDWRTQPSL
jgi:hypothetical protein